MTVEKLRYFIEVARSGSISQAAKRLYVSQPNLSKQIAQMESECGIELFSRVHHRLELTAAGEVLYDMLLSIPDAIEEAFAKAKDVSLRNMKRLSIGVMELQAMNGMLMPAVRIFRERHPGVEVNLERTGFGNLRKGLIDGRYDMIVTMRFDAANDADFDEMVLDEPIPMIAVHKDDPLAKRKSVSFGELRNSPFVLVSSRETPRGEQQFLNECARFGFVPKLTRRPSSLESLLLCVEAGIGIALLDSNIILDPSTPVRLVPVSDIPSVCFSAAWPKKNESRVLKEFLQLLEELT